MVPQSGNINILSIFTLALAADSGFFNVNFNQSEELHFGKYTGCEFVFNICECINLIFLIIIL